MKLKLLLISSLFINEVNSQTLLFSYDLDGNQIKREILTISGNSFHSRSSSDSSDDDENVDNTIKKELLNQDYSKIDYYPNPVVDLLNIEWPIDLVFTEIILYDNNGRILQNKKIINESTHEFFDFSSYPQGFYYINIFSNSELQKSFKIIKK